MPVCEIDLREGGAYRYEWHKADEGTTMGMGGVYREVLAPERLVATERFDEAWYQGEAILTQRLIEENGRTELLLGIRYQSKATRDGVLRSPMKEGVGASYDRLADLVETTQA